MRIFDLFAWKIRCADQYPEKEESSLLCLGSSARDDKWSLAENRIVSGSERDHFHFLKSHRDNQLHLGGEGGEGPPAGGGQGGLGRGQQGGGEVGLGRAGGRGWRGEDLKMVQVDF